jgi:hypothetical protein
VQGGGEGMKNNETIKVKTKPVYRPTVDEQVAFSIRREE